MITSLCVTFHMHPFPTARTWVNYLVLYLLGGSEMKQLQSTCELIGVKANPGGDAEEGRCSTRSSSGNLQSYLGFGLLKSEHL